MNDPAGIPVAAVGSALCPVSVADAEVAQRKLAERVRIPAGPIPSPRTVAGLDVSYAVDSERVVAAAVVADVRTGHRTT